MSNKSSLPRLVITLFAICLVAAAALGAVNSVTAEPFANGLAAARDAAMNEVLPAHKYSLISVYEDKGEVLTHRIYDGYNATDSDGNSLGYVFEVKPQGFGGEINMLVGIDVSGSVTGVAIVSMSETSGLGTNAKDAVWRSQFVGKSGTVAVSKDGGDIDALTGATITSRAVVAGVNEAIEKYIEFTANAR